MNLGDAPTISNPTATSGLWMGGLVSVTAGFAFGVLTIQEAKGFAANPLGGVVPWLSAPVSGSAAAALFPVLGGDTTYYVYIDTANYPTSDPAVTVSTSSLATATQVKLASVLVPAGITDPSGWTVTVLRTFTPFGYGIPGHSWSDTYAHPTGELGIFLGHSWDGVDVHEAPVTSTTLADLTQLVFALVSGYLYTFRFAVLFQSTNTATGIKLGLTFPSVTTFACNVRIPVAADGTDSEVVGRITSSGDSVVGTTVEAANTTYEAIIEGTIQPSAAGNLQVQVARGGSNNGVSPWQGANGRLILQAFPYASV